MRSRERMQIPRVSKYIYAVPYLQRVRQDFRYTTYSRASSPFITGRKPLLQWPRARIRRFFRL